jgi:hypothetical protein
MMIKKPILTLILSVIIFSFSFIKQANATCEVNNGVLDTGNGFANPVNDVGDGGISDQCNYVPDVYQIDFYRMSLCTSNPDSSGSEPDFSSCVDMISETGDTTTALISGTNETELSVPDFTIPPGSYGYMVARLSAKLGIKHTFEASTKVNSSDSDTNLNGVGTYCWTVNNVLTGVSNEYTDTPFGTTQNAGAEGISNMQCSDNESDMNNAEFSYEVVNVNAESGCTGFGPDGDRMSGGEVENGIVTGRMMQNATTSATACTNTDSILWTITLTNQIIVTSSTRFVMNFKTTDAVSIDFDNSGDGADNPYMIKVGANPIEAYLTVTN